MCATDFNYILFGDDKMVLCKKVDFNLRRVKKAIKKYFPRITRRKIGSLIVESCRKMYSSQFDCQVYPLEEKNDWQKQPYMVLWIFQKEGKTYCGAKAA